MHRIFEHFELAAKSFDHSLQTETDAECRNVPFGEFQHQLRNAKIGGPGRAWRDEHNVRLFDIDNFQRQRSNDRSRPKRPSAARSWREYE